WPATHPSSKCWAALLYTVSRIADAGGRSGSPSSAMWAMCMPTSAHVTVLLPAACATSVGAGGADVANTNGLVGRAAAVCTTLRVAGFVDDDVCAPTYVVPA